MFTLAEYTSRDGMTDPDRARYAQLTASLEADLRPDGALEICFAAAVLRGTWREQQYAAITEATLPDDAARAALARERRAAAKSVRWGLGELRKIQTDRHIGQKLGYKMQGLVSIREVLKFTGQPSKPTPTAPVAQAASKPAASDAALLDQLERMLDAQITDEDQAEIASHKGDEANFTERTQLTPRNAPCTCGSGEKYKRCCGKNAPAVPGNWLQLLKDTA
ncbi:MAG: hypothetical protein JWN34_4315 [Bryobacterales bacterium]|nr:hypothetical protein [Bryobacterales bacterium]